VPNEVAVGDPETSLQKLQILPIPRAANPGPSAQPFAASSASPQPKRDTLFLTRDPA